MAANATVSQPAVITRIGPFSAEPPAAWMFTIGTISLACAIIGYAWLATTVAAAESMTCSIEGRVAGALALVLGSGVGCFLATAFARPITKVAVTVAGGTGAAAVGFLLAQVIYAPQCRVTLPLLRRLLING